MKDKFRFSSGSWKDKTLEEICIDKRIDHIESLLGFLNHDLFTEKNLKELELDELLKIKDKTIYEIKYQLTEIRKLPFKFE